MSRFHGTDPASVERRLAQLAEIAEDERRERVDFIRTLALLVLWPTVALLGMAWGFQMNDRVTGISVFYGSVVFGNLGILWTLVSRWLRAG